MIPVVLLALFGPLPMHDQKTPSSELLTVGLAGASSCVFLFDLRTEYIPVRVRHYAGNATLDGRNYSEHDSNT